MLRLTGQQPLCARPEELPMSAAGKPALVSTGIMMPLMEEQLEANFEVHWLNRAADPASLLAEVGPRIRAICTGAHTGFKTDKSVLAACPGLEVIGNFGVGYDSIDVAEAARRGIVITNTPDVLNEEVADTAIGLLIMTVRNLGWSEQYLRAGRWPKEGDVPLTPASLRDRTVGIVGMGRIGKAIGRRLEAFGTPVVYHSRRPAEGVAYRHYPKLVDMARDVDVLLAIVPGGPSTERMIDAEVLAALGPNGIFINMARGSIVDEEALIAAILNRTILSAGLDVYLGEPKIDERFFTLPHTVLLPHVGSSSLYTRSKMGQLTIDNLLAWKAGRPPITPVPETPFTSWRPR
jgi:lactate dehydrogenase-like 2-hydroxyacid dehydrogenase